MSLGIILKRQTWPGKANFAICNHAFRFFRCAFCPCDVAGGGAFCRPVFTWHRSDPFGRSIYAWLHLGLYFSRHPLLLQRLFLRLRTVRILLPAQLHFHCLRPNSAGLSDIKILRGHTISYGPCDFDGFFCVRSHLYLCIYLDAEKERKKGEKRMSLCK